MVIKTILFLIFRLGETCSHVGAVLFKVEASVRLGITAVACTSAACEWNNVCVKNIEAARIKEIMFYKSEAKENLTGKRKRTPTSQSTPEEQNELLGLLAASGGKSICLSTFAQFAHVFSVPVVPPENPPSVNLPPTLRSLYGSESPTPPVLEVTEEQIALVEEQTLDQALSDVWHLQRAGRITGSTAHLVLHTNIHKPANSIITKICKPASREVRKVSVQWGKQNEQHAIQTYSYAQGICSHTETTSKHVYVSEEVREHTNPRVEKAGFRICKDQPYLGR